MIKANNDLLRDTDTSHYIKRDTQLWESETAVVIDIIQTLFCLLLRLRETLSTHYSQHATTLTLSQTCQCFLNWENVNMVYCLSTFCNYFKCFIWSVLQILHPMQDARLQECKMHSVFFFFANNKCFTCNMYIHIMSHIPEKAVLFCMEQVMRTAC